MQSDKHRTESKLFFYTVVKKNNSCRKISMFSNEACRTYYQQYTENKQTIVLMMLCKVMSSNFTFESLSFSEYKLLLLLLLFVSVVFLFLLILSLSSCCYMCWQCCCWVQYILYFLLLITNEEGKSLKYQTNKPVFWPSSVLYSPYQLCCFQCALLCMCYRKLVSELFLVSIFLNI